MRSSMSKPGPAGAVARFRGAAARVSLLARMSALIAITLIGLGSLAAIYNQQEASARKRLADNSTYIELEKWTRQMSGRLAGLKLAVGNSDRIPVDEIRAAVEAFAAAAAKAQAANPVKALAGYFKAVDDAIGALRERLSAAPVEAEALAKQAAVIDDDTSVLVAIAVDGAKAEWRNLLADNRASARTMLAVLIGFALLVSVMGFLIVRRVRSVFGDVIRINAAIKHGDHDVAVPEIGGGGDIARLYGALRDFRDGAAEQARMSDGRRAEQAERESRQARIEELIGEFRRESQALLAEMETETGEMNHSAACLTDVAERNSGRMGAMMEVSESSAGTLRKVAESTEALARSVEAESRQAVEAQQAVLSLTEQASETTSKVGQLSGAADRIGEIVTIIRDISEQTNLLALNATIEAARAGEMGKGFAVVASEVKALALQTGRATGQITEQIAAIQGSTGETAQAIGRIAENLGNVRGFTDKIAEAIHEQDDATREISEDLTGVSRGIEQFADDLGSVAAVADEARQIAAMVETASSGVTGRSDELRRRIDAFLDRVAAA